MHDALDCDVSAIAKPVFVRPPYQWEPELFFDGDRFLFYLNATFDAFDVMTYSMSNAREAPLQRVRRLLANLPMSHRCDLRPHEVRYVINNHAKLYLCYTKQRLVAAYVGSQNLTQGTQINFMYRVREKHVRPLARYFNQLWRAAKKG